MPRFSHPRHSRNPTEIPTDTRRGRSDQETLRQHHPFTLLTTTESKILYKLSVSSFLLLWISCYHSYKLATMTKVAKLWYFVQKNYHGKFIEFVWLGPIQLLQRNKKRNLASNVCKHAFTDKFNTAIFKRQKESMKNKWTIG